MTTEEFEEFEDPLEIKKRYEEAIKGVRPTSSERLFLDYRYYVEVSWGMAFEGIELYRKRAPPGEIAWVYAGRSLDEVKEYSREEGLNCLDDDYTEADAIIDAETLVPAGPWEYVLQRAIEPESWIEGLKQIYPDRNIPHAMGSMRV